MVLNDVYSIVVGSTIPTKVYKGSDTVWVNNFIKDTDGTFEDGIGNWIHNGVGSYEILEGGPQDKYLKLTSPQESTPLLFTLTLDVPIGITLQFSLWSSTTSDSAYKGYTPAIYDGADASGTLLLDSIVSPVDWTNTIVGEFDTLSNKITLEFSLTWSKWIQVDNLVIKGI